MEKLEALPSIARLSSLVIRVLGQNPGKFTLQGTNTYLIGRQAPFILVDTGEGKPEYVPFLETTLRNELKDTHPPPQLVSEIILSHRHHDHHKGLPSVLNLLKQLWGELRPSQSTYLPPRVYKLPIPGDQQDTSLKETLAQLIPGTYVENRGSPLHDLHDLQTIPGNGTSLRVFHTPGHTEDSVCLFLPDEDAIFTADSVLGQGTAVFEDLAAYIKSLQRLLSEEEGIKAGKLYPGHGPVVEQGKKTIEIYIQHRLEREAQIVDLLKTRPPEGRAAWTVMEIVKVLYKDYPKNLWSAAAHGIRLHLQKLESEDRARKLGGSGDDEEWELI